MFHADHHPARTGSLPAPVALLLAIQLLTWVVASAAGAAPIAFAPGVTYAVGQAPRAVAIGDLNGDGHPDLVTAGYAPTVSVLLGIGTPMFAGRTDFETGPGATAIEIADLNRDGHPDVLTVGGGDFDNHWFSCVSVLLGNGDGTLAPRIDFACGREPMSMAIADLDRDGDFDVVVVNREGPRLLDIPGTVTVLLGNGDGTLTPLESFGYWDLPRGLAIADFDGDGAPDLAVADHTSYYDGEQDFNTGRVSVLRGHGDGTFGPRTDYPSGEVNWAVAVGDVDADGRADLAISSVNTHALSLLLGHGDGTFGADTPFACGSQPLAVAAGDLDRDGALDLVATDVSSSAITALRGNGDGTFGAGIAFGVGVYPWGMAIADLDGDHWPDVAVANRDDATVSVLFNRTGPPALLSVDLPAPVSLALRAGSPGGRLRVAFTLGDAGPARLELADVTGRMLESWPVGTLGAGTHTLDLAGQEALPAGVYFLRLTQAGIGVRARVAILH